MRAAILGAALLTSAAVLAIAPAAHAQDAGYPSTAPYTGADVGRETAPYECGGYGTVRHASTYGYGRPACSDYGRCNSPYAGYSNQPYSTSSPYPRYSSSQSSPFFGPGGEAYSYAGYGGFSPYGYGAGTNCLCDGYGTSGIAATSSLARCTLPTSGSAMTDVSNRPPDSR
jgi:hypothetical protein